MNEEELKLYTILQPLFREKMGELLYEDRLATPKGHVFILGLLNQVDRQYVINKDHLYTYLPLSIDDRNPERGLVGMLNNFWDLSYHSNEWFCRAGAMDTQTICESADSPTLAILKVLVTQQENSKRKENKP